jgi:hypothetical protein
LLQGLKYVADPLNQLIVLYKAYSNPRERSFTCNNLRVKISYSVSQGTLAHKLETFLCANYGSREKRKVQGEAANSPAKQRKVRKSKSPDGGQGGGN